MQGVGPRGLGVTLAVLCVVSFLNLGLVVYYGGHNGQEVGCEKGVLKARTAEFVRPSDVERAPLPCLPIYTQGPGAQCMETDQPFWWSKRAKAHASKRYLCVNMTRCAVAPLKLFVYPGEPPLRNPERHEFHIMYNAFRNQTDRITYNPEEACWFFANVDTSCQQGDCHPGTENALRALPHWDTGLNHLYWDIFDGHEPAWNHANASRWKTATDIRTFAMGFDVSFPLHPPSKIDTTPTSKNGPTKGRSRSFEARAPDREVRLRTPRERAFFASFKGQRFRDISDHGRRGDLLPLHNESKGVIIATYCSRNGYKRPDTSPFGSCKEEGKRAARWDYDTLLHESVFGLIPEGAGRHSYRLIEVMRAGGIPVFITNYYVPPFSSLLDWSKFSVTVSKDSVTRVIDVLEALSEEEIARLHARVVYVWENYFAESVEDWVRTGLREAERNILYCQQ